MKNKKLHLKMAIGIMAAVSFTSVQVQASEATDLKNVGASGFYVEEDILYITDSYTNQIFHYDGNKLKILAGNPNWNEGLPQGGYHDGIAEYTLFDEPFMAVPWNDGVIISDTRNHVLRFVSDGIVETYSGKGEAGYADGNHDDALFYLPTGLAVDDAGNLYVADTGNGVIRKVSIDGEVSTYFSGMEAPLGLYWYDYSLYVTDVETNQIFCITSGAATLVAGQGIQIDGEWISGYTNGSVEEATFSLPQGIYVDEEGIYIGDVGNNAVRFIADGIVSTYYEHETLADPVAIVKYEDYLYVGDPFMKSIQMFEESESEVSPIVSEDLVVEEAEKDVEGESATEVTESSSMNFIQKIFNWIMNLFQ